jgi:hypothetical protein
MPQMVIWVAKKSIAWVTSVIRLIPELKASGAHTILLAEAYELDITA